MSASVATSVWRRMRAAGGNFYRTRLRRDVPILTFHRIRDADGTSEATLAKVLDHCAERFTVNTMGELAALMRRGRRLPRNAIVLTFDDCTRDQLTAAVPALRARGLRATFGAIGCTLVERQVPVLYRYFHALDRTRLGSVWFGFEPHVPVREWRLDPSGRRELMDWHSPLLQTLIRCEHAVGVEIASAFAAALDVPPPDAAELFITLEELRRLEDEGHEAAAHSLRHVDVDRPDPVTWRKELREDFELMTDLFGRRRHSFIFPFGYDHSAAARAAVRDAGFGCAATTEWGTNTRRTDVYALRRVGIDTNTPVPLPTIY